MNKKLVEWIYNPTALCVVKTENGFSSNIFESLPANFHPQEPLQVINSILKSQTQTKIVLKALKRLATLMKKDTPLSFRPELFKQMNALLKILNKRFANHKAIFKASFAAITALKEQIDHKAQSSITLSELEWVELEKAVYLLCDWEDEIEFSENESHESE